MKTNRLLSRQLRRLRSTTLLTTAMAVALYPALLNLAHAQEVSERWSTRVGGSIETLPSGDVFGGLRVFLPVFQDDNSLVFVDMRGVFGEDSERQGTLGLGIRQILPGQVFGQDAYIGLNAFGDIMETENGRDFNQGGAGIEFSTSSLDLFANYYSGGSGLNVLASQNVNQIGLVDTRIVRQTGTINTFERSFGGFDVGASVKVPLNQQALLRLNGGYYEFGSGTSNRDGYSLGLGLDIDKPLGIDGGRLSLGANYVDENRRGSDVLGFMRLDIPLGQRTGRGSSSQALNAIDREITRGVQRRSWIFTDVETANNVTETQLTDAPTGEGLNVFFVAESAQGMGDCTIGTMACTFTTADGQAGAGDIFVLVDNAGDISSIITLNADRQQVLGGGADGTATAILSDVDTSSITLSGLGNRPIVAGVDIGSTDGAIIDGLTTNGSTGITGSGFSGTVQIRDIQVQDGGVNLTNANGAVVLIANSTLEGGANAGLTAGSMTPGGLQLDVSGSTISTTGAGPAVDVSGTDSDETIVTGFAGNTVTGTGGVQFDNVTFDADGDPSNGITAVDAGDLSIGESGTPVSGDGLRLNDVLGSLSFDTLNIENDGGTGLFVRDDAGKGGTFALGTSGGTITTTNGAGIDIDPVALNMTLDEVNASGGANGILLDTVTGSFVVTGGAITGTTDAGIAITNSSVDAQIGTSVTNSAGNSVSFTNNSGGSSALTGDITDTGDGIEITGNTGGSLTISNATIGSNANPSTGTGVNVEGNTGGSFTIGTLNTQNSGGVGVAFNNNASGAELTIENGTITATGTAQSLAFTNNTGGSANVGGAIEDTGAGIAITDNSGGNLTVESATIGTSTDPMAGTSLTVEGNTGGSFTFEVLNTQNSEGVGVAINNNAAGTSLSVEGGTIGATGTAQSLNVMGNTGGTFTIGGAIEDTGAGVSISENSGGNLTVENATIGTDTDPMTTDSVSIMDNTGGTFTFETLNTNNLGGTGLFVSENSAGVTVDIQDGQITKGNGAGPSESAVLILGGGADVTVGADIVKSGDNGASFVVIGTTGGTVTMDGNIEQTGAAPTAIFLNGNAADVTFGGDMIDLTGSGIEIQSNTGQVFFGMDTTVSVTDRPDDGVSIEDNPGAVVFGGMLNIDLGTADSSAGVNISGTVGGLGFADLTITDVGAGNNQTGIDLSGATLNGAITAGAVDISGPATSTSSVGIDLTGVMGNQLVRLGDPDADGASSQIVDVHRGVLIDPTASVQFTFGDGENGTDTGSIIDVNGLAGSFTVDALAGTLPSSTFNFLDVEVGAGDSANFTASPLNPVFVSTGGGLITAGTNNLSQDLDTVSVMEAEAQADTDQVFVFVGDGMGQVDVVGGDVDGFTLEEGQSIIGFNGPTPISFGVLQPMNVLGNLSPGGGVVTSDGVTIGTSLPFGSILTLAGGNRVEGFDVEFGGGADGIVVNAASADTTVENVAIGGTGSGGTAISVVGSSGNVVFNDVDVTTDLAAVSLLSNTGNVTFDADSSLNVTGVGSQPAVGVQIQTAGTVNFNGDVTINTTGTGTGVFLNGNTGGTVNFNGGLDIDTTDGFGFAATNGGTINIDGGASNSISSTNQQALSLLGVTIGATGITFESLASTNASNDGIALSGINGGTFRVTGDTVIDNASQAGIDVEGTNSATFEFADIDITNVGQSANQTGIDFSGATLGSSFTANSVDISGPATSTDSIGINLTGLLGNQTVRLGDTDASGASSTITGLHRGVVIDDTAAVQFTFGDGENATDQGSTIDVNGLAGSFTVDAGAGTLPASTFNFLDVTIGAGDMANFPAAGGAPVFVSTSGGLIMAGTNGLSDDITTISVAAANVQADTDQTFVFIGDAMGEIDLGLSSARFILDAGQNILGFNSGTPITFGSLQPANISGDLGSAGGVVTSNVVTATTSNSMETILFATENSTVSGFNIDASGTDLNALEIASVSTTLTVTNVEISNVNAFDRAVSVSLSSGTVNFQNVDITGAGSSVGISNSTGTITFDDASRLSTSGNGNVAAVQVSNQTGGSVTFNGLITANQTGTGIGILLTDNTGGTINFDGGLDIDTNTGTAFSATGGGTIFVDDPAGVVEADIAATAGQALNLDSITIAAGGVEFSDITSTNSPTTGISVNNVDGGTLSINAGDDVTITGSGGDGIVIQNTSANVTFEGSTNFPVITTITNAGDRGVDLINNTGDVTFGDLRITNPVGRGLNIAGAQGDVTIGAGAYTRTDGVGGGFAVAISSQNAASTISFTNFDITGDPVDTSGPDLFNVNGANGTINVVGGTFQATNENDIVDITGGAGTISIGATIIQTGTDNTNSNAVEINSVSGGSVTFTGTITQNGQGSAVDMNGNTGGLFTFDEEIIQTVGTGATDIAIDLTNNTGAAINFNGGVDLTTTTATTFNATGGGTITSDDPAGPIDFDLTSTAGTALNLNGVTIGAAGLELSDINATGGTNGIVIDGVDGGLIEVTPSSDVIISGTTGDGIIIQNSSALVDFAGTIASPVTTTVTNAGANGVTVFNNTGTVDLGQLDVDGSTGVGLRIINQTGDVTAGGTIGTMATNAGAVAINGGAGTITINAALTDSSGTARGILVENRTGGTINFLGNTNITSNTQDAVLVRNNTGGTINFGATDTATVNFDLNTTSGAGVNLSSNTGATINFNDGFDIDTGSGTAFTATGGGTVTVNDPASPTDAELTSTAGVALNLNGVTIGAAGFDLSDVNATGGANGVVVDGVDGGTLELGAGDTITVQNTTGDGIVIQNNSANVDFSGVSANPGNVVVTNAGGNGVTVNNNTGTVTFGTMTITNPVTIGLNIDNGTGAVNFDGQINVNSGAVGAVDINGTVGTVSFNAGLNIDTTSGTGLAIANAEPVNVIASAGDESISTTSGTALSVNSTGALNITLDQVNITGLGTNDGISLTNATGTVVINGGTITTPSTGDAVVVTGGTVNLTNSANIASGGLGAALSVSNRTGGAIVMSGTLTDTNPSNGGGLVFSNNSGGTTTFNGDVRIESQAQTAIQITNSANHTVTFAGTNTDIDTTFANALNIASGGTVNFNSTGTNTLNSTSGRGIQATGGGNVTIGGSLNVASTTGVAVFIENTTIGTGGVTLRSVSSDGAFNGINLNNTGNTGGVFTVAGDGSTSAQGGNGSGGTITNSGSHGINLFNANNVVLNNMTISNSGDDGIFAVNVNNLDVNFSTLSSNGDAGADNGIDIVGLAGNSNTIANSIITGSAANNVRVVNTSGTGAVLTVSDSLISATSATIVGTDGIQFNTNSTASADLVVRDTTFDGNVGDAIQLSATGTSTAGLDISGSTIENGDIGLALFGSNTSQVNFTIDDNMFDNFDGRAIFVDHDGTFGGFTGSIINNTINDTGADGIFVRAEGSAGSGPAGVVRIDNNAITRFSTNAGLPQNFGIRAIAAGGTASLQATITNNVLSIPGSSAEDGIRVESGGGIPGEANSVCLNITNNDSTTLAFDEGAEIQQYTGTTFQLQGFTGDGTSNTSVEAFLEANNTLSNGSNVRTAMRIVNYTAGTCTLP